ncbi:MAG: DUF4167 domain-containing protein [Alphaproteobacteria bacterium]|nr:DUF4167 domain-containing protein [Alphaproteobacteria bacterium]
MRHAAGRRHRNRGGQRPRSGNGGNNRNQVYDSNGPDVRIRGTAYQIVEKYAALAKDAASAGDRVLAESYLQHAEHYQRIIGAFQAENPGYSTSYSQAYPQQNHSTSEDAGESEEPQVQSLRPALAVPADDDLSLPASILGNVPAASSQAAEPARISEYGH